MFVARSSIQTREFRSEAEGSQIVLASVSDVAQRASALETVLVVGRRRAFAVVATRTGPAGIRRVASG